MQWNCMYAAHYAFSSEPLPYLYIRRNGGPPFFPSEYGSSCLDA